MFQLLQAYVFCFCTFYYEFLLLLVSVFLYYVIYTSSYSSFLFFDLCV